LDGSIPKNGNENILHKKDLEFEIDFFDHSLTPENKQKAEGYDAVTVFVDSNIDQEVIECLDADVIVCRSTGFDHIDLDAASEKDIKVSNVPEYGGTTVAEHCFGLILSLSRKIYYGIRKVEKGDFSHENLRGFDLKTRNSVLLVQERLVKTLSGLQTGLK